MHQNSEAPDITLTVDFLDRILIASLFLHWNFSVLRSWKKVDTPFEHVRPLGLDSLWRYGQDPLLIDRCPHFASCV